MRTYAYKKKYCTSSHHFVHRDTRITQNVFTVLLEVSFGGIYIKFKPRVTPGSFLGPTSKFLKYFFAL